MDQQRQGICSTKSLHTNPPSNTIDTMEEPKQAPQKNKTNMVFTTVAKAEGQLFTDQTSPFPVTSNKGNNYIVLFYIVIANFMKFYPIKSCHRTDTSKSEGTDQSYTTWIMKLQKMLRILLLSRMQNTNTLLLICTEQTSQNA
ncbi:hypothetical protein ACHAW6_006093 [Cyclotella cf. meneghiniana]